MSNAGLAGCPNTGLQVHHRVGLAGDELGDGLHILVAG